MTTVSTTINTNKPDYDRDRYDRDQYERDRYNYERTATVTTRIAARRPLTAWHICAIASANVRATPQAAPLWALSLGGLLGNAISRGPQRGAARP
jgi:hypothetical protein